MNIIMNFLTKLAKTLAVPCIGLGGAGYYLSQPEKRKLDEVETIMLNKYIPPIHKLVCTSLGFRDVIVGGSFALQLYTDRVFPVNDYDVYVNSSIVGVDYLVEDKNRLKTIYPGVEFETDEFSYDSLASINGIIKTNTNDKKIQYIMMYPTLDLTKWYKTHVDVPVFIKYYEGEPYFYVRSRFEGYMAKYCGVLFKFTKEDRIDKYKDKGFWLL